MFIAFGQPRFGAPAERNVLADELVAPYICSAGAKELLAPGIL
jgi:hypothetical protein